MYIQHDRELILKCRIKLSHFNAISLFPQKILGLEIVIHTLTNQIRGSVQSFISAFFSSEMIICNINA